MSKDKLLASTIICGYFLVSTLGKSLAETFAINSENASISTTSVGFSSASNGWRTASSAGSYLYDFVAVNFSVDQTGTYTFGQESAPVDTTMAVYYNSSFDLSALVDPNDYNDDSGDSSKVCGSPNYCPAVTSTLTAGQTHTLVISTYRSGSDLYLPMTFFVTGAGSISFSVAASSATSAFEPVSDPDATHDMAVVMDNLFGGIGATPSDSLRSALTSLSSLSDTARGEALKRIQPNASVAFADATSRALQRNTSRIGDRMSAVRASASSVTPVAYTVPSATARNASESFDVLTGQQSGDSVDIATHGEAADLGLGIRPNSLWGQFYGFRTFQDMEDGYAGYDSSGHSYLVGFDLAPAPHAVIGIAGGYTKTYVNMDDYRDGDTSNVDSFQVSLYGSYEVAPQWMVDAIASYVRHSYSSKRGTTLDTAYAEFGANQFGVRLDVSRQIDAAHGLTLTPKAGFAWSSLYQESYEETGSALAQSVDASTDHRFRSNVSLEVSKQVALSERFYMVPSMRVGWAHDFLSDGTDVTARFVGGGDSFTSVGQTLASDSVQVRSALELVRDEQLHLDLGANGEFAQGFQDYGGQVRVSWKF